jgi:hypothetical protein
VTLFHRPTKSGVPRGLRRAGEAIKLAEENPTMMLHEAVEVIAQRHGFDSQQTRHYCNSLEKGEQRKNESKPRFLN